MKLALFQSDLIKERLQFKSIFFTTLKVHKHTDSVGGRGTLFVNKTARSLEIVTTQRPRRQMLCIYQHDI